jgi:nucleoside 2-deoxyribosyltransferase
MHDYTARCEVARVKTVDPKLFLGVNTSKPAKPIKVYLIGSLRNIQVTRVSALLRDTGFDVFDDWFAAGPTADDAWKEYEQARGRTYKEAMQGYAAKHVFEFDKKHIDEADIGVLLLPAGKSAHAELGYMKGKGKKCIVYLESDAERWDIMYNFFDSLVYTDDELIEALNADSK